MNTELAPCPFCGAAADINPEDIGSGGAHLTPYHAGCRRCRMYFSEDEPEDAIAAWNRRAASPVEPPLADSFGFSLAAGVLQSDLYRQLDDRQRAECDELMARGLDRRAFHVEPVAPILPHPLGWQMLVSEDLERSWLRIAAPNGSEMAFSAERGSLTAQLLQDFGIALASPVEPSKPLHTPGPWFIRKRTDREGNLLDCFVAAKDVNGFAYDAEILGDDEYRDGIERKLADCELVVRAVNAALASPVAPAVQEPQTGLTEMGWIMESGTKGELAAYDQGCEECNHAVTRILDGKDNGHGVMREPTETLRRRLLELVRAPAPLAAPAVQEPVAWRWWDLNCWCFDSIRPNITPAQIRSHMTEPEPLYAAPGAASPDKGMK
jgi:hypothetical protein